MLAQMIQVLPKSKQRGRKAKPQAIFVSKKIELDYYRALLQIVEMGSSMIRQEIMPLLTQHHISDGAMLGDGWWDNLIGAVKRIKQQYISAIESIATTIANKIISSQKKATDQQLSGQIKKLTGLDFSGLMLDDPKMQEAYMQALEANIALIQSIPRQYMDKVEQIILNGVQSGLNTKSITAELMKATHITEQRAKLIAIDQLGKINSKMTQLRQQQMGITHYTWHTSQDERVRHEHRLRNGKIFAWDTPPKDGHAGMAIRCRCVAIPYMEHLIHSNAPTPEALMKMQAEDVKNTSQALQHVIQSANLLQSKFASQGLSATDFLNHLQVGKQGNPALRLSQILYDELKERFDHVPLVWAVNHYTIHSKHINDLLRGKPVKDEFLQASQNAIDLLDQLFAHDKALVKSPFSVWRGQSVSIDDIEKMQAELLKAGFVRYGDLAFRSTTLSSELAKDFSNRNLKDGKVPVIFKLNLNKNVRAIDISSYHFYTGDSEILLNRRGVIKIMNIVKKPDGSYEIEADVLDEQVGHNIGDKKYKVVFIDDSEVEDDPRYGKWSSTGFLILSDE